MKKKTKAYLLGLIIGLVFGSSIVGCFYLKSQDELKESNEDYIRLMNFYNPTGRGLHHSHHGHRAR